MISMPLMTVKLVFDKRLQTNFHFYYIRHEGVTNAMQYNICISKCKRLLYLWPCFGFQTVLWLFKASSAFASSHLRRRSERVGKEWDAARSEGEAGDKVLKMLQWVSNLTCGSILVPPCQDMRKEKKWQADKKKNTLCRHSQTITVRAQTPIAL